MDSSFEDRVQQALDELSSASNVSLRAVEKKYGVSRRTLRRRQDGHHSKRTAHESQQLLTRNQEDDLVKWILYLEADGHAPKRKTVGAMASQVSHNSGGPKEIGKKWLLRFFARHPEVHSKQGKRLDILRASHTNIPDLNAWFAHFQRVLRSPLRTCGISTKQASP
jgi:Tc5 transposase DNA-binding domain